MILDEKYVFHIPLVKKIADEDNNDLLVDIENIDGMLEDLFAALQNNGYDFYTLDCKSYYDGNYYDERLVVAFTSATNNILKIFKDWFNNNNDILCQEYLAYESNGSLTILPAEQP